MNHIEIVENLEQAVGMIFEKIAICEFYAAIYSHMIPVNLSSAFPVSQEVHDILDAALPQFYAAILCFLVKARQYFDPTTSMTLSDNHSIIACADISERGPQDCSNGEYIRNCV